MHFLFYYKIKGKYMNIVKKVIIRVIAGIMPTKKLRRSMRNCLTFGFGKTHYRGGKNNKIIYIDEHQRKHIVRRLPGCYIYFYGDNNYIEIHGPLNALRIEATLLGNSKITIKQSRYDSRYLKILGMINCSLEIGKDFCTNGQLFIQFTEDTNIKIGDDCMFSYGIIMRTGDGHKIKSLKTGELINKNQDIMIGNHVWIACKVTILKGVVVSDNSVVAACSLVNKKFFETNVILAGTPAQIKKQDISWER